MIAHVKCKQNSQIIILAIILKDVLLIFLFKYI